MNWAEMVIAIVVVVGCVMVAGTMFGGRGDRRDDDRQGENDGLREELRVLRERIQVLERLATDDSQARRLDREIERLRDRH